MAKEMLDGTVLNWASILEEKTRQQAIMTSKMPFIFKHLALMPDAHLGKGATVGSVIPTDRAIIPAAVGVDIGCVDKDSEYLSPTGWRKISEYVGGPVMQYDPETGQGAFVEPSRYVVRDEEKFFSIQSKYGINQFLSADHKMLVWDIRGRDRHRVMTTISAADYVAEDTRLIQGFKAEFETTFTPVLDTKVDLSDEQIRVQVMLSADGFRYSKSDMKIRVKKQRKIERVKELLSAASIEYRLTEWDNGVSEFTLTPPVYTKDLSMFWEASLEQLKVIAEECIHWDGNADDQVFFTRDRGNADFIHYAFTATGKRGVLRSDVGKDGVLDYRVFAQDNTRVARYGNDRTPVEEVDSVDGKSYCFTVPSGFWVMRRGGNVVMTGNCGMQALRTQFTKEDFATRGRENFHLLREAIEKAIPLSAGGRNQKISATARPRLDALAEKAAPSGSVPGFDPASYAPTWEHQLGSLGSGNHFIEVTLDELDRVWLFLHSGSRGIGNKIATHHIKVAQDLMEKWWIALPDRDLAYLVEGTEEFDAYIRELTWAQAFATENRSEMMDRLVVATSEFMGAAVEEEQFVECSHNYTSHERHFGKQIWLSRKGAIDASEGKWGLIPGSMGTASYVVVGKGNRESFNSAPHGAGREYSRSAARKRFTREELRAAMGDIEFRDTDAFVDEIPAAYKDIDRVMDDANDLVEIKHTLRQILNVKGD
jgi:tRNA-splicing ligase RtcB